MRRLVLVYLGLLVLLAGLWLLAAVPLPIHDFFALRSSLMNGTGVLTMGAMSAAMILAARPARLESALGGLDKAYRLHKWLGITSLSVAVGHWLLAVVPKWLVGWGLLVRPPRKPGPPLEGLAGLLREWRHTAEGIGEWAFYAALILVAIALLRWFPYRSFFKTHRLFALVYLPLAFHSLVLLNLDHWTTPLGPVMAVLLAGGIASAFVSLFRRAGARRRVAGTVETFRFHPDNRVLEVDLRVDGWEGHRPGQFAFVTFHRDEGAHPFTIASSWEGDGRLRFHVKGLGDYTKALPHRLRAGDPVVVEGPYGRFDFAGRRPRQLWVAGGIGVTPFLARLRALALRPEGTPEIDLFFSTQAPDESYLARLRQLAEEARVRLHVRITPRDGLLTAERIRQEVPAWRDADVWFCGPAPFGKALRRDLVAQGLAPGDFHQEFFAMR